MADKRSREEMLTRLLARPDTQLTVDELGNVRMRGTLPDRPLSSPWMMLKGWPRKTTEQLWEALESPAMPQAFVDKILSDDRLFLQVFLPVSGGSPGWGTMPTGIPTPPAVLGMTLAEIYGSDTYYTRWVDNTHPSATDSGNPNGSPTTPRLTIPTSLSAGDVVQIRGGPYTVAGNQIVFSGTGTAANPIIIRGPSYAGRSTISATPFLAGPYVICEYLKFNPTLIDNGDGGAHGGSYCFFRACELAGSGVGEGGGSVMNFTGSTYCGAVSCVIHDWGQWQASGENDLHGLGTGGSGTFIWYLWNTVYHLGGDGCGNSHLGNYGCHDVFVGGNTFYECRENGIDLKTTYNYVISENIIHDFTSTSTSSGEGIVLHYGGTQDGPYNIWVLNNTIYNCALAIAISDSQQDNWLIGNVIYDCTAGISVNSTSTVDCKAYHNTIYNCTYDILYGVSQSDARASGNILANAATRNLEIELSALTALGPYQNNCLYNSGGGALIRWYNTFYSGASAVASWIAGRSNCSGNIQADPQFVNAAAHDFTLQSGSPCRGAGYNMAAIAATFAANWGTSLLKDAGGTARPNGVWDIGAYQYAGGVLPPVGSGTLAVR